MNRLRWLIYRRCACPVCLRWPHPAAAASITACFAVLWTAIVISVFNAPLAMYVFAAAAACTIPAVIFGAWPAADHAGDDLEALIDATRECGACSPQDHGPCRCTEYCGNIRCAAGFPALPDFPVSARKSRR